MSTPAVPVVLVRGGDEVVQRAAVLSLVDELVGERDRSLTVEEVAVGAPEGDADPLAVLVDAAQTPPLLTDRRVVVGRIVDRRTKAADVAPLVEYLADPLPSTCLVLDWNGGTPPKSLLEAIERCGGAVREAGPGRRSRDWVKARLSEHRLTVDEGGLSRLETWLGEDVGQLIGLVELLVSTYGEGARLGEAEVGPFLGDDGGVPPWELTDAIDAGHIATALDLLHRMLGPGGRHPFQLLATLHNHYARILRLDGADVRGEQDAAALLGLRGSTFPARKALATARRLGPARVRTAVELLAGADLDLRGAKAWPDALVLEVLVARLARLSAGR
ncbi:MAG: DNA polymerase III subunit delta [Acidimicrobiia bacterium]